MKSQDIILHNYYIVRSMPKTKAKGFDTVRVGDIIHISLPLTYGRGRGLYAYYPLINGVSCAGIPLIQSLMDKGMVLEEILIQESIDNGIKELLDGFKKEISIEVEEK